MISKLITRSGSLISKVSPKVLSTLRATMGRGTRAPAVESHLEAHHAEVGAESLMLGFTVHWHNTGKTPVTLEDAYLIIRRNRLDENGVVFASAGYFTQHEFTRAITKHHHFRNIVVPADGLVETKLRFSSHEVRQLPTDKLAIQLVALSNEKRFELAPQAVEIPRRLYYRTSARWSREHAA